MRVGVYQPTSLLWVGLFPGVIGVGAVSEDAISCDRIVINYPTAMRLLLSLRPFTDDTPVGIKRFRQVSCPYTSTKHSMEDYVPLMARNDAIDRVERFVC